MKKIFRIALIELQTLFYSPIAWLALIIFCFQSCWNFFDIYLNLVLNVDPVSKAGEIFARDNKLIDRVQQSLFLYIPVLTMGIFSREFSSGSIKLILSSPVHLTEAVLGKFFGMILFGLMLVSLLLIPVLITYATVDHADVPLMLSGILGTYLLVCAYCAIGLFMSCLTFYQVVAAISTFVVLALLSFVGSLWQHVHFVRELTYFLSISGRTKRLTNGLINSKDIEYFVLISGLFIGLAIIYLQSQRETWNRINRWGRYVALFFGVLLLGNISTRPSSTGYWDVSHTQRTTVSANTQAILKKIKDPLTITYYSNIIGHFGEPIENAGTFAAFDPYQRFLKNDVSFNFHYYYDSTKYGGVEKRNPGKSLKELAWRQSIAEDLDFNSFIDSSAIKKIFDSRFEEGERIVVLQAGDKKALIRDDITDESQTAAALHQLIVTPPKVLFLTGHNESSYRTDRSQDYSERLSVQGGRTGLIRQGFIFEEFDINNNTAEIPDGVATLVIADPALSYAEEQLAKINRFIERGGNVCITGSPQHAAILAPVLQSLGIEYLNGRMVQGIKEVEYAPNLNVAGLSTEASTMSTEFKRLYQLPARMVTHDASPLAFKQTSNFSIWPLLITNDSTTWFRPGLIGVDTGNVVFDLAKGDTKTSYPVAVAMERKINDRLQRILVFSQGGYFSNGEFSSVPKNNRELTFASFAWICNGPFPVNTKHPDALDTKANISKDSLYTMRKVVLIATSAILIIIGASLLIYRSRK